MKTRLLNYLMSLQVVVLCIVLFAPIAWMILASFKPRTEITRYPPELFFTPTLENYQQLFTRTDFLENTLNSFYVAGGSTLLGLLLAVPAAYAISWHRLAWPATLTLFVIVASTMRVSVRSSVPADQRLWPMNEFRA